IVPDAEAPLAPTHWSFGQLCSLVGAPPSYLRELPAPLAGINLQYGLSNHRPEQVKFLETANGRTELRAATGPDYGRIYDHELVEVPATARAIPAGKCPARSIGRQCDTTRMSRSRPKRRRSTRAIGTSSCFWSTI